MTKVLVWGFFILAVGISIDFHDKFAKQCREAGGIPTMTVTDKVCLSVNAIIELKGRYNDE